MSHVMERGKGWRALAGLAIVMGIVGLGPVGCHHTISSLEMWSVPSPASAPCRVLMKEVENRGIMGQLLEQRDPYGDRLLARNETWVIDVERKRTSTLPDALAAAFDKHPPRMILDCGQASVELPVRLCAVYRREYWIVDPAPIPATLGATEECWLRAEQAIGESSRYESNAVYLRPSLRAFIEQVPAP